MREQAGQEPDLFSALYSVRICSGLVADVVKDEWVRRMFNAIFQEWLWTVDYSIGILDC